ncbi:MAG: hypothetical protein M0017_09655 [Desulfobacteraceae bacterium]|nr:hypothetical protein [Desulfobacteraceae bacterium]
MVHNLFIDTICRGVSIERQANPLEMLRKTCHLFSLGREDRFRHPVIISVSHLLNDTLQACCGDLPLLRPVLIPAGTVDPNSLIPHNEVAMS